MSWPSDAVAAKDLEVAIAQWETDIQRWESASGERVSPSHRKLALEEMCPERFRAHLRLVGTEKLSTYEAMRAEIADWIAEEFRKAPRPRATALGQAAESEQPSAGTDWEPAALDFLEMPLEDLDRSQLMALVKSIKLKGKKGLGKGTGPRKWSRVRWRGPHCQ